MPMIRPPRLPWAALLLALLAAGNLQAAEWPAFALPLAQSAGVPRGEGMYLNLFKFIPVPIIYLLWVWTTHWVEKDTRDLKDIRYEMWNSVVFFVGVLGFILVFFIPVYFVGILVLLLTYLVPLFLYISHRNADVDEYDKVLTPYHLGEVMNGLLAKMKIKPIFNRGGDEEDRVGPPIQFISRGSGEPEEATARLQEAEEADDYIATKELLYDAVQRRATDVHLEPSDEQVQVRYRIDGILHPAEPFERVVGDGVITILKLISALDVKEKRKPQEGAFSAKLEGREVDLRVSTSGTKTGEKMALRILDNAATVTTLDEVGMRPRMVQQVKELLMLPNGLVLCAGPTGAGKTTTLYACLREIDRFQRNIITVEEPIEYRIENTTQMEIDSKSGQDYATKLRSVLRQDPDIIMIGEIRDQDTAEIACQAATTGHLVFSTVHANDSLTALQRMLDLGVENGALGTALAAIIAQRLVRVLCENCKEPYKPKAEYLQKANLPADKIDVFYRPPENPEQVCPACGGTGYIGRTGIFELLLVTDALRELVREGASSNAVKAEARRAGLIFLQEDGLRLVIQGKTSIQELRRVTG
jgi:type II secretory ATPase GspE/PulE/Tfp pilus assembly ATPase PilB-like protein